MEISSILTSLNQIEAKQDFYQQYLNQLNAKDIDLNNILQIKTEELNINIESKEYYTKAVDLIYSQSIGQLETIINNGLQFIFYDKDYSIQFKFGNSRNKTLKILLEENGHAINLKSGTGASARSVISFILLTYYLMAKNSYPVLFLDETYTQVSADYVEKFFEYISLLCEQKKFIIVLITHDLRFMSYADKSYTLADGNIINQD